MSVFNNPTEHAENPPDTWTVRKHGQRWELCTKDGGTLDSFPRKLDAEAERVGGHLARLYADETRWYAGESVHNWIPYAELKGGKP